ncbi:MAG: hypothetical protein CSA50_05435 [Gammaproteobacteria bacterium]|nr:MAG: hypothetical protein CSA50_05435 [Gammaproteobacteria bacterium]
MELILYTASGCHLCDIAETIIAEAVAHASVENADFTVYLTKTDIADNQVLVQRYAQKIPVLKLSESARELAWPFDIEQVLQLFESFHG